MGTIAAVSSRGASSAECGAARQLAAAAFEEVTREFNAFDPASRLNGLAPRTDAEILSAVSRSPHAACYRAAFALRRATEGAFDPRWKGAGTLDFGAIAKGYAVDLAAARLTADPKAARDLLLDLGGNLKSVGGTWRTGVKDPAGDGFVATVALRSGEALATSATYYRGRHIRDGRTGVPVTNGVASVTVLAPSAMWADGLSTTLFVLGSEEGRRFLGERLRELSGATEVAVLWVMDDGRRIRHDPAGRFALAEDRPRR